MIRRSRTFAFLAWGLVILGIFFPFLLLVSALLPLCINDIHVRRAGLVSSFIILAYVLLGVLFGGLFGKTYSRHDNRGGRYHYE